jgi:hypothetical protein
MSDQKPQGFSHEKIETHSFLMVVLIVLVIAVGGLVEIVPLFFQSSTTQPIEGRQASASTGIGRTRHLCARGLLQLPFANDSPLPLRNPALRALLCGG